MKEYLDYLSDAIVQCRIAINDEGKADLVAVYANKPTEYIVNKPVEDILNKKFKDIFPVVLNSIFDWPKILSEAAMTSDHKVIEQYVSGFDKFIRFSIFGFDQDTFYVAMQDLTEKKEMKRLLLEKNREIRHLENEIKAKANIDMLTKLYNFQFINESIKSSITSYREEGISFCLLVLDIDDFKKINDTFGHHKGDLVLTQAGQILSACTRKEDVIVRFGGDEFCIWLYGYFK